MFSLELVGKLKDKKIFEEKIKKIYDKHINKIETETSVESSNRKGIEAEAKISFGKQFLLKIINIGAEFRANYQRDKQYRTITREFFQFSKNELLEIVNDLIYKYYEEHGSKKKVLAIFDDLEKIKDIQRINTIFIDNRIYLNDIDCKKILSVPVHLASNPQFAEVNKYFFNLKIYKNPLCDHEDNKPIEINKARLIDSVKKRIESNAELISDDAIKIAIQFSGGNIRQFLQILYKAALNVLILESNKISSNDVEEACQTERLAMEHAILGKELISLLSVIMKDHIPDVPDSDLFVLTLLCLQTILYRNDSVWYDVNPLIKETIKRYSGKRL
ncbi:MAG: hypothetical protein HY738_12270 [Bacteroidia bacterium]|nr:hypothetical protein [Bacteroidia bacterium]